MSQKYLSVYGAKENNLKNIDINIPKETLTVITGLSGSGKSTLAFDTIYAEGQRRYVESLSTYARQFLQMGKKPDCEGIEGLSPAISIDQKTTSRNPRSTVGTVTEIYDYLRLLYAKIGTPHCPECDTTLDRQTPGQIVDTIGNREAGSRLYILAPLVIDKKGEHEQVINSIQNEGFVRMRIDGQMYTVADEIKLEKNKKHTIEIVVDRLVLEKGEDGDLTKEVNRRLIESVELALKYGQGICGVYDPDTQNEHRYSEKFSCPYHPEISMPEISPRMFSFNSPHGACPYCQGLGSILQIDPLLVVPNPRLTIEEGALAPFVTGSQVWQLPLMQSLAQTYGFTLDTPWKDIPDQTKDIILNGPKDGVDLEVRSETGKFSGTYTTHFTGVCDMLLDKFHNTESEQVQKRLEEYMRYAICPECHGARLRPESLSVKVAGLSIVDFTRFSITQVLELFSELWIEGSSKEIARPIIKEIHSRTQFLLNVGLPYLTLDRSAVTLSWGEAQRIRLATQIGSQLSGVLYVLDEPSIGLHQRDNMALIGTLKHLRDLGNTVIVVEHDEETMMSADYIIDIGPGAGVHGGELVAQGAPKDFMEQKASVTAEYLDGRKSIELPKERRQGHGNMLDIYGAHLHNLKDVDMHLPLGTFTVVSGVSGSGKSSLINGIFVTELAHRLNRAHETAQGYFQSIQGVDYLDKIISVDQSPIGRTPRSNPATYTGVFSDIRSLFTSMPESKARGYKDGRFSFNVKGGRCESCKGEGVQKIEMHFLPDIFVECEVCKGRRYNPEVLEIKYRGKDISEVLDMTVDEAVEFFAAHQAIINKLKTLQDVGLGYIKLGQNAVTLSGGEAQRIKLATELSKRSTGKTVYVLDEPTTGLHFDDIKRLLSVINRLVDKGNTVLLIEHNLDVIKSADHVIDIGPEGGDGGGKIVATGTPEEIAQVPISYTGKYLKKMIDEKTQNSKLKAQSSKVIRS